MTETSTRPAILVEGLTKSFGDVHALRGIDLSVPRGTVLGVLGPNGAGKTTAVRILTTLLQPDGGRAMVEGRDVVREAAAVRRSIGLSGQSAAIQEELTGRENLELVGRLYHLGWPQARSRAVELLAQFELADAADRAAKTYSGGMQRRLDLAASLVGHPQVLFLDEPTTGLDPRARLGMWDIIRSLVADGTTLLLTTQYLDEADELADEIVVIDHGQVIAAGTSEELKGRVGGDVLEFTVPDRTRTADAVTAIVKVGEGEPHVDEDTGVISIGVGGRGSDALIEAVRALDGAGVATQGLSLRRPSLDDVFLALTGHAAEEEEQPAKGRRGRRRSAKKAPQEPRHDRHCRSRRRASGRRSEPVHAGPLGGERHAQHYPAEPAGLDARARVHHVHGDPAGHVRAAVPLRVRRRDPGAGCPGRLRQLPDAGDHRPVGGVRDVRHRHRAGPGTEEGRDRPAEVDADGALGGAGRRLVADTLRMFITILILVGVGYLVGFRFLNGFGLAVAMVVLATIFGLAICCIAAFTGLAIGDEESVQAFGLVWLFPLTFVSSAFVPISTMPGWLQAFAKNQPVTIVIDTMRSMALGGPIATNLWLSIAWLSGIFIVFVPLAVRAYRRAA